MTHTVIIHGPSQRAYARTLVNAAPEGFVMTIRPPRRTVDQNAKLWAMLTDVSRAKPDGRNHPPETWKALFMHALGWEQQFHMGLNGEPFPAGFRSSRMNKEQMSDLIEFIYAYGAERGVVWSEVTA